METARQKIFGCVQPMAAWRGHEINEETGKRLMVFSSRYASDPRVYWLPCGQCSLCQKRRQNDWMIRQVHEAQMSKPLESYALTLTYDDMALMQKKKPFSLEYRDVQLFNKAVRKHIGSFRFFCAGEYGTQYSRPHWHINMFGLDLDWTELRPMGKSQSGFPMYESEQLSSLWGKGRLTVTEFNGAEAAYVAKYAAKGETDIEKRRKPYKCPWTGDTDIPNLESEEGKSLSSLAIVDPWTGELYERRPEGTTQSNRPGLGASWIDKYWPEVFPLFGSQVSEAEKDGRLMPRPTLLVNGYVHAVPRYYVDRLEVLCPERFDMVMLDRNRDAMNLRLPTNEELQYKKEFDAYQAKTRMRSKHVNNVKFARDDTL